METYTPTHSKLYKLYRYRVYRYYWSTSLYCYVPAHRKHVWRCARAKHAPFFLPFASAFGRHHLGGRSYHERHASY
jgi:hypothetical protein